MSEETREIKKAQLLMQLVFIPAKAGVAFALLKFVHKTEIVDFYSFLDTAFLFIIFYSICTLVAYFAKAAGNWLVGLILFFVVLGGLCLADLPEIIDTILGVMFMVGGAVIDFGRIIQYIRLSIKKVPSSSSYPATTNNEFEFFADCATLESLNERYKSLQEIYSKSETAHKKHISDEYYVALKKLTMSGQL